jgi:SAM-dependent methyltransferase
MLLFGDYYQRRCGVATGRGGRMSVEEESRARARATWAAGDWEVCSKLIAPVGELVLERADVQPGMRVLDVGTGNGGNIAIPAAFRGADVVGVDVTPELLVTARQHARAAGVGVEWLEADAQDLPFPDASFDRVISTFGAMFAPDHVRAGAQLVRVCAPAGRILMTTWVADGFVGELFKLSGSFMPVPPGVEPPSLWGVQEHVEDVFRAAGASALVARETVDFEFASVQHAVRAYVDDFGPFVIARGVLEPQGRWDEFVAAFTDLVRRFNAATDGTARLQAAYFLISIDR